MQKGLTAQGGRAEGGERTVRRAAQSGRAQKKVCCVCVCSWNKRAKKSMWESILGGLCCVCFEAKIKEGKFGVLPRKEASKLRKKENRSSRSRRSRKDNFGDDNENSRIFDDGSNKLQRHQRPSLTNRDVNRKRASLEPPPQKSNKTPFSEQKKKKKSRPSGEEV